MTKKLIINTHKPITIPNEIDAKVFFSLFNPNIENISASGSDTINKATATSAIIVATIPINEVSAKINPIMAKVFLFFTEYSFLIS